MSCHFPDAVTAARRILLAGGAAIALSAVLPSEQLVNATVLVDPDRTIRPLLPFGTGFLRVGLVGGALLLWSVALAVPRLVAWLGVHLEDRPAEPTVSARGAQAEPMEVAALGALMLLGAVLRIVHLDLPLSFDESTTYVMFASRSLLDVLTDYSVPNNHVLHTALVWASTTLFGIHPLALRAPAFLAGMAAIPVAYYLGRREGYSLLGVGMAALLAVAPPFVEFSAVGRGYTLQLLFFLLCLHACRDLLASREHRGWWQLVISSSLGLYTIPSFVMPLGGMAAWLTWQRRSDGAFLRHLVLAFSSIGILSAILYLPLVVRSGWRKVLSPGAWDALPWEFLLSSWAHETQLTAACWGGGLGPVGWVGLVGLVVGVAIGLRANSPWAMLFAFSLVSLVALTLARSHPPPSRTIHWLLIVSLLGAGGGHFGLALSLRARRWAVIAIVGFSVVWGAAQLAGHARHRAQYVRGLETENYCVDSYYVDARAVMSAFSEARQAGDLLVVPRSTGMTDPLRFHAMSLGLSPASVFPLADVDGPSPITGFPRWFVAIPKERFDTTTPALFLEDVPEGLTEVEQVAAALRISPQELNSIAETVGVWREFRNTLVFVLEVRAEVARNGRRLSDREIVRFRF